MKLVLAAAALALVSTAARADQCQWVEDTVARKARLLLRRGLEVSIYCEPCGDKYPSRPFKVSQVQVNTPDPGQPYTQEVSINGIEVDLAYTFLRRGKQGSGVPTPGAPFENMAKLVGCPASGVSDKITVEYRDDNRKGRKSRPRRVPRD